MVNINLDLQKKVLMHHAAYKEYENIIKNDPKLEKKADALFSLWKNSDSDIPKNTNKFNKLKSSEFWKMKNGTLRLIGFYNQEKFFVLKCITRKSKSYPNKEIKTCNDRKKHKERRWKEI